MAPGRKMTDEAFTSSVALQQSVLDLVRMHFNIRPRPNYTLNGKTEPNIVSVELSWDDFSHLALEALK